MDEGGSNFLRKIRVLGIAASPRENSRSEELLDKLLAFVSEFGGEPKKIRLTEKVLYKCQGCYSGDPKECTYPCRINDDDMAEVLEEIIKADSFAFATPVHWSHCASDLYILKDRMTAIENNRQELFARDGRDPLEGKPFVTIASQDSEGAMMALSGFSLSMNAMGMVMLPYGIIYRQALLGSALVRFGLRLMRERRFEWIDNTIRLAAKNLVELPRLLRANNFLFDDHEIIESRD